MPVQIKTTEELEAEGVGENAEEEVTVEGELDSSEETEWDSLAEDEDEAEDETVLQEEEPGEQEEVETEEAAQEVSDEVAEEPVAESEVEAEAEPAEEEVILAEEPVEEVSQEQRAEQMKAAREKATEELVEQFQLTEDQADELVTDPNKVLPQMLANMYLDLFTSVMQGMQAQLPNMVQGVVQSTAREAKQKNAFFAAWPQLNKPEHLATVQRIGESYGALNKGASQEDFIKEVGAQAWVALRLPLDELLAQTQGGGEAAEAPVTSRAPASPGNTSLAGRAPRQKQMNEFEQLADELLLEDS